MAGYSGRATGDLPEYSPSVIGQAFCSQYYNLRHQHPSIMHRFYTALSSFTRAEAGVYGAVHSAMSPSEIQKMMDDLDLGHFKTEIISIESQGSDRGAVFLVVTGSHYKVATGSRRTFLQSFLLVPQEDREAAYDVINDVFRYLDQDQSLMAPVDASGLLVPLPSQASIEPEPPLSSQASNDLEPTSPSQASTDSEPTSPSQASTDSKPTSPSQASTEPEPPLPSQASIEPEPPLPSQAYTEPEQLVLSQASTERKPSLGRKLRWQEVWATSIAEVEISESSPATASIERTWEEASTSYPTHLSYKSVLAMNKEARSPVPSVTYKASPQVPVPPKGSDFEARGSVYVGNLPLGTSVSQLTVKLETFGRVKSGSVDLKGFMKGVCYAFVDFEDHVSAQSAVDSSPITFGGQQVDIEWNRSLGYITCIMLKNLRPNTAISQLNSELGKFGLIKDGGIRVSFPAEGVCHAVIDFKDYTSARAAVASSPLYIEGRRVFVEERIVKRPILGPSGHRHEIKQTTPVGASAGLGSIDQPSEIQKTTAMGARDDHSNSSDHLAESTKKTTPTGARADISSIDHLSESTQKTTPMGARADSSSSDKLSKGTKKTTPLGAKADSSSSAKLPESQKTTPLGARADGSSSDKLSESKKTTPIGATGGSSSSAKLSESKKTTPMGARAVHSSSSDHLSESKKKSAIGARDGRRSDHVAESEEAIIAVGPRAGLTSGHQSKSKERGKPRGPRAGRMARSPVIKGDQTTKGLKNRTDTD